jgi:hypothetical protein
VNQRVRVEKTRGDHAVNIMISHELKERILRLATTYDQSLANTFRQVLRIGIPVMEGMAGAQEQLLTEYVALAKRLREAKGVKEGTI